MSDRFLQEQLLDAWLKLSSVISNNRLVSGFSFNEAFVLNLLYKQYERDSERKLTATDLCRKTNILKSQMNAILTSLEKKGMIFRRRSGEDRRQLEVELNPEGLEHFIACHERSLHLVDGLMQRVGEEEVKQTVTLLNAMAECFKDVQKESRENSENIR